MVLAASPVSEYVVDIEAVFDCMIDQVVPPSFDLSILYPVIAELPLLLGVVQLRLICDEDAALAVRPVGDPGTVDVIPLLVVAEEVLDGELVPTEFIADTL